MYTMIEKNTFIRFNKYNNHQKDSIGWFKYTDPILTLQRTTREKGTDALFQVYLTEEDMTRLSKESRTNKGCNEFFLSPYLTSTTK